MKILFLGGVFDETLEKEILKKSKGVIHYAANKFQWNLINGLIQEDNEIEILSAPFVGSFPRDYKSLIFKSQSICYKNKVRCEFVGFNNLWGYKNISRKKRLIKSIQKDLKKENYKGQSIVVYSTHTPFLQSAVYAKKKDPSIHICLIVPDLPEFMNLNAKRSVVYDSLKKVDINIFKKNLKYVDSFVLLTEAMREVLDIGERPFVVVEGIVDAEMDNYFQKDSEDERMSVVYTGTLNKKFGVVNLLEAFHKLDLENVDLKLCGSGDSEELIKEYVSKDSRIKFLGQLSNEESMKLQREATVLVNPRQNNEEFTKYSFPSKNMEYLLMGVPVVAYKLDGIPDDYDDYFFYIKDNSIESLRKEIEEVIGLSDHQRDVFGKKAKSFVVDNKNNLNAVGKIMSMWRNDDNNN